MNKQKCNAYLGTIDTGSTDAAAASAASHTQPSLPLQSCPYLCYLPLYLIADSIQTPLLYNSTYNYYMPPDPSSKTLLQDSHQDTDLA